MINNIDLKDYVRVGTQTKIIQLSQANVDLKNGVILQNERIQLNNLTVDIQSSRPQVVVIIGEGKQHEVYYDINKGVLRKVRREEKMNNKDIAQKPIKQDEQEREQNSEMQFYSDNEDAVEEKKKKIGKKKRLDIRKELRRKLQILKKN